MLNQKQPAIHEMQFQETSQKDHKKHESRFPEAYQSMLEFLFF